MKYEPSLPAHNDNVGHEHPLKDLFVILGGLLGIAALVFWLLGLAVDAIVDDLSAQSEARLYALMPDGDLPTARGINGQQAHLQAMVDGMRACAGLSVPARVSITDSPAPNAAVGPGGHIVVFSGLLGQVRSENGLAFVLAHELAHLSQRDHLRAMGRGIVLFGLSALVLGNDSGLTEVLAPAGQLGVAKHSRTRETAADMAALRILACRYGHAGGATEFFKTMRGEDDKSFALSHYMASHPGMDERIAAIDAAIRQAGMQTGPVLPLALPPRD